MDLFIGSYYVSVFIQFISLFIQMYGYFFINVTPDLIPLKYALSIEFFVSIVELLVYLWIGFNLSNLSSVMGKRYLDWFITTNFLVVSVSLLMIYFNQREERKKSYDGDKITPVEQNNTNTLIERNLPKYAPLVVYNNIMLLVGFLGERGVLSKWISTPIGFAFFFLGFYHLYHFFAKHSHSGKRIFYFITSIWAMYGIAHTFRDQPKNIAYNVLDLLSKNAFGVFMVYMLLHPNAFLI
tara:strand:- start:773 stop:1489 length:717 start_codon:yes stop_codon:yes gene_type:complete